MWPLIVFALYCSLHEEVLKCQWCVMARDWKGVGGGVISRLLLLVGRKWWFYAIIEHPPMWVSFARD